MLMYVCINELMYVKKVKLCIPHFTHKRHSEVRMLLWSKNLLEKYDLVLCFDPLKNSKTPDTIPIRPAKNSDLGSA